MFVSIKALGDNLKKTSTKKSTKKESTKKEEK